MSTLTDDSPMVVTEPDVDGGDGDWDDDLIHVSCECSVTLALCGGELNGEPLDEAPDDEMCVVCLDLEHQPCPRCGSEVER